MVALICSYRALVLGVRLSQARYSSDVNTLGEDGILPVAVYRHNQCSPLAICTRNCVLAVTQLSRPALGLTSVSSDGRQFWRRQSAVAVLLINQARRDRAEARPETRLLRQRPTASW